MRQFYIVFLILAMMRLDTVIETDLELSSYSKLNYVIFEDFFVIVLAVK